MMFMKTIYLTRKQIEARKKWIDKIILENLPFEVEIKMWISTKYKKGRRICKTFDWKAYEKTIDGHVASAKKIMLEHIALFNLADEQKKILVILQKKGEVVKENKKYVLKK